jgi:monoamine oxidase
VARDLDVIVIGAGLAGLTAAERLVDRAFDVGLLEARSRVGGRTWSGEVAGQAVDFGAEHVGPHHHRVRALARRLGLKLKGSGELSGRSHWELAGRETTGRVPPLGAPDVAGLIRALTRMSRLARRIPVEEPWRAPSGPALDAISLADWLDQVGASQDVREFLTVTFVQSMTKPADRISMLHLLWLARRSGGIIAGFRDALGPRVEGGTQQLALGVAKRLGSRLELGKVVAGVEQSGRGVEVSTRDGERRAARRVIVCVPIAALARLEFSPGLPEELEESRKVLSFGRATALIVGTQGAPSGRIETAMGGALGYGWRRGNTAKCIVVDGSRLDAERLAAPLARATDLPPENLEIRAVAWTDEEFSGGTYVCFEPGELTRFGPHLTSPHGRVHFASAERSTSSVFMEGAIESGERAAAEVSDAIVRDGER